jgi:hypothetical protein
MTALIRLTLLGVLAVPVFTGWPALPVAGEIVPGIAWAPAAWVPIVLAAVAILCGGAFLANTLAVTVLIVVPIVFVGGTVSWLLSLLGGAPLLLAGTRHASHYIGLALNMLAVVPLALALVAAIPFDRLEHRLLGNTGGIAAWERYLLMFVRVFHHTVYFVIPNLLEVMREEALLPKVAPASGPSAGAVSRRAWPRRLTAVMVQVAVSGICAALRFIPLWAREIDDLPRRSSRSNRSET